MAEAKVQQLAHAMQTLTDVKLPELVAEMLPLLQHSSPLERGLG